MSTEERRIRSILDLLAQYPAKSGSGLNATAGLLALDDCAVIPISSDIDLVFGSDFIRGEGFHLFKRGILSWRDVGYYLVGANVSDLAAMGAAPLGIVVVLRYTSKMTDEDYKEIMEGILMACSDFEIPLLGGDSGGYDSSVLSAAAVGVCPHSKAMLRSQGRAGDALFVTGDVGLAGAALAYFTRAREEGIKLPVEAEEALANSWRRLKPAVKQGLLLVEKGLSRCAIDTSDGLKASCRQLAEASKLDAVLYPDDIPIAPLVRDVADTLKVDPLALAVGDSVDFRLVFSADRDSINEIWQAFKEHNWSLFQIGELVDTLTTPTVYLKTTHGLEPVPGVEWAQSDVMSIDQLRKGAHKNVKRQE
jgi:thiamine-monophosphate kinase